MKPPAHQPPRLTVALARLALEVGLLPIARRHADKAKSISACSTTLLLAARVALHETRAAQLQAFELPAQDPQPVMDRELARRLHETRALVVADQTELALAALRGIVTHWPAALCAWLMLACIYLELREAPAAADCLHQALRLQPHHAGARRLLHHLASTSAPAATPRLRHAA